MAITSGAGQHRAWITVDGSTFPVTNGRVGQSAKRKSSRFSVSIPLSYKDAFDTFSTIGKNEVTISTLTRGVTGQLLVGPIQNVGVDLIGRTLEVSGGDNSVKLHENKTSEKWLNKKPSDIVQDLIGRVGLSGNITGSSVMAGEQTNQDFVKLSDNVSFGYVIHKMSELDGARWFVDNMGVFQYVPLNNPTGIYSLSINQDLQPISSDCLVLNVKRNLQSARPIHTTIKSWHPKDKKVYSYTSVVPGNGDPMFYNYHIPNLRQEHVQKYAQSQGNEKARHELTVSATVVGDPTINASMGLSLSGTNYFDQTLDMDTVTHEFGMRGHTTHITARSAKAGRVAS